MAEEKKAVAKVTSTEETAPPTITVPKPDETVATHASEEDAQAAAAINNPETTKV